MSYESGTRIGKYEIRRRLGKGAMGEVFVAWDTMLERHAALKIMSTSTMEESDLRTRFEREAKAVARLQHPNIVTVYDFGYDERQAAYIVMELLRGTDLEHRLKTGPPTVAQSLRIVLQVCRGLAHAHDHDIVHRDIKPANIFVAEGELVKIMDFGIARWTQASQTKTGTVIGTAAFMSPEQLLGQRVDGRSDIFSLGVILYQLLSHKRPFRGEDVGQIFYRILNTEPPRLLLEGEEIPGIQRILDRALAKDLDQRYRSAHEMAQQLAELIPDLGDILVGRATMSVGSPAIPMPLSSGPAASTLDVAGGDAAAFDDGPAAIPEPSRASGLRRVAIALAAAVAAVGGLYVFSSARRDAAPPPVIADVASDAATIEGAEPPSDAAEAADVADAPRATTEPADPAPEPTDSRPLAQSEPTQIEADRRPTSTPAAAPPPAISAARRAAAEADAAGAALDRGELVDAGRAIARGRQLDAAQPVWRDLDDRLQALRAERDQRRQAQERAGRYLEEALGHLEADQLDESIAAFRKTLVFDPENVQASNGLRQVESLKRKQEALQQPSASQRSFSESTTVLASTAQGSELEGFSADDSVRVEKGSADLSAPGEVLIELNPRDAKPSEPYTLTVRLHNETNTGLLIRSLELVTSYGGRKLGEGVEIPLNLRRIDARSTAVLHQASGQWKEEQNAGGSITATVTLVKGKLKKSLTWSAGS